MSPLVPTRSRSLVRTVMRRARWRFSRFYQDRRGATLALVAVSSVSLLFIGAIAVDIGMLWAARAEAQRAADSAALAGASVFIDASIPDTEKDDSASARAYYYAAQHTMMWQAITNAETFPTVLVDSNKVRVIIRRDSVPLIFARALGLRTHAVSARSAAKAFAASGADCVKPFAIPDMWDENDDDDGNDVWDFDRHVLNPGRGNNRTPAEIWEFDPGIDSYSKPSTGYGSNYRDGLSNWQGQSYTLDDGRRVPIKISRGSDPNVPSYWYVWRLPGQAGASDARDMIKTCHPVSDLGQAIEETGGVERETGNMVVPIYQEIIDLIDNGDANGNPGDPTAVWNEATGTVVNSALGANWMQSARVITIGVINPEDIANAGGSSPMRFVDFALLFLEDPRVVYNSVNPNHQAPITARLLRFNPGIGGGSTDCDDPNLNCRLRLVE